MSADQTTEKLKKLNSNQENLVIIGSPTRMTGILHLENNSEESVIIGSIPIKHSMLDKTKKTKITKQSVLQFSSILAAGESKTQKVYCSMDQHTAPGTYEGELMVGGKIRKTTMIVQNHLCVSINPGRVYFFGVEPKKKHIVQTLLVNEGNIPIAVPDIRHSTTLDKDLFCRNRSFAIRDAGEKGFDALLDTFVKGLRKDMVGWVDLSVKEAGQLVEPGQALLLNITITLPKDINPDREYKGNIRIYNKLLYYTITPEPKSLNPIR